MASRRNKAVSDLEDGNFSPFIAYNFFGPLTKERFSIFLSQRRIAEFEAIRFQLDNVNADVVYFTSCNRWHAAEKNLTYSLCLYQHCKERNVDIMGNEDLAMIYGNRSLVRSNLERFDEAIEDARKCIGECPEYTKGLWRLSQAYKGKGNLEQAVSPLLRFLEIFRASDMDFKHTVVELSSLVPKLKVTRGWEMQQPHTVYTSNSTVIWEEIIHRLVTIQEYDGLGLVTVGMCSNPRVPEIFPFKAANISGFSGMYFNVGQFLHAVSQMGLCCWHLKVAEFMVTRKASLMSIAKEFKKPLLVAMTELSLKGQMPLFMNLAWERLNSTDLDDVDEDGASPFHVLARNYLQGNRQRNDVDIIYRDLINHGCIVKVKDRKGKFPHEYVPSDQGFHTTLKEADSSEAAGRRLEYMRKHGNEIMKKGYFDEAIKIYDKALALAAKIGGMDRERAVLHCNKAITFLKSGNPMKASEAAASSVAVDKEFHKAYWHQGRALAELGNYSGACDAYVIGYRMALGPDKLMFVKEVATTIPKLNGSQQRDIMERSKFMLAEKWPDILDHLTTNAQWKSVQILVMGPPYLGQETRGYMNGKSMDTAKLDTIFQALEDKNFPANELVVSLVKSGASIHTLSQETGEHLHTMVKFCLLTGKMTLLRDYLASAPREHVTSARDKDGQTPLHTLCKTTQGWPDLKKDIAQLLFECGVDAKVKDKHGKEAWIYATPTSAIKHYVQMLSTKVTQHTSRPEEAKSTKPAPYSSPSAASDGSWMAFKESGNHAFKQGQYDRAHELYSRAIAGLKNNIKPKQGVMDMKDSHNLSILFGNRAECWYKRGEMKLFLDDAKSSVSYDGSWYRGHYRVGRAFRELGKPAKAVQALVNAYKYLSKNEYIETHLNILADFFDELFSIGGSCQDTCQDILNRNQVSVDSEKWALLAVQYMKKDMWLKAGLVYSFITFTPTDKVEADLKVFCNETRLRQAWWVPGLLLFFLLSGTDESTLQFHPGDTYLHATVTILVLTASKTNQNEQRGVSEAVKLMTFVLDSLVKPRKQENIRDSEGNTALHCLAKLKGPRDTRVLLLERLLAVGVDVMAKNKAGHLALDITLPRDDIRTHLSSVMAGKNKSQEMPRKNEKSGKKTRETSQEPKAKTKPARAQANQGAASANARPAPTASARQDLPCDECERFLEKAADLWRNEHYSQVYTNLVKVVNAKHHTDPRHPKLKSISIQRIAAYLSYNLPSEIPPSLTQMNVDGCREVLNLLAAADKWRQIDTIVANFKAAKGRQTLSGFAKPLSLLDFIKSGSLQNSETVRLNILELFLSHGAVVDKGQSGDIVKAAMANSEFKVVKRLLDQGADPQGVTKTPGDTPNHAALQVALSEDVGNFSLLDKLRQLYLENKESYAFLDPSVVNSDGSTLLHLAAEAKFNKHSLRAVELLCDWQVPFDRCNKAGKLPIDYLTNRNDRRALFIRPMQPAPMAKQSANVVRKESEETNLAESVSQEKSGPKSSSKGGSSEGFSSVKCREEMQIYLEQLPGVTYNYLDPEEQSEEYQKESEEEEEEEEDDEEENNESEDDGKRKTAEDSRDEDETEYFTAEGEEEDSDGEQKQDLNIDASEFDDLTWDVECTEDVWNLLRARKEKKEEKENRKRKEPKKISDQLKKIVVKKIKDLATGNWRPSLKKPVSSIPGSLQLFRASLPNGGCILWELAVAFSPRRSKGAEIIQESEADSAVKSWRIYSEVIRVWAVVLKPSELKQTVNKIASSHTRGEKCIIQKNLKGIQYQHLSSQDTSVRNPVLYMEADTNHSSAKELDLSVQRRLFHPASARKTEFHILKFYSFSSMLVSAVLHNIDTKIDFPFKVTDIEHDIISLESSAPLLLLGRSGTGKTTCCLYRLWSRFLDYWEQANRSGSRLLPRIDYPSFEEENEEEDVATGERKSNSLAMDGDSPVRDVDGSGSDLDVEEDGQEEEEEEEEDGESGGIPYLHLQQLFVTKNRVLCSEVEKNFMKFRHASDTMNKHNTSERQPLPNTLQEVDELSFPLFLTSKQLLLMLDASVDGTPFFQRDEDLALKVFVPGWGNEEEDIFNLLPRGGDFSDDDSVDEGGDRGRQYHAQGARPKLREDLRRECTYEMFASYVWPKISKKVKIKCHPSLVWTEIMSFIKGSYEALHSPRGYLDLEQYLSVGSKRAPSFAGDRAMVHEVFLKYVHLCQKELLFDEADLVFRIYSRLIKMDYRPWVLHEIYVDETQDFTQAELSLLLSLCEDPNKMFLTGDTAQSIMRGISFRFEDLRSLFYYAKTMANDNQLTTVKIPEKVHQLTHNYRSHTGILFLASAVLDILLEYFPESFDPLKKDQGMFVGPQPVVIEASSPGDLALLLTGNQRETSHIEFGAHQAILVVNEPAKNSLPKELSSGIVLTIYESKGLEFDDVLIYNFFKDSQALKEWRVVTDYLERQANTSSATNPEASDSLIDIDADLLQQTGRPRPISFDPQQHKVLNSELKHLYTALTRARVNIWIFDEDKEKRAPMFEYFKARKLVTCMSVEEANDASAADTRFFDKSSPKEWKQAGDRYMAKKLYSVAAKCYGKANLPKEQKLALAYLSVSEALALSSTPTAMRSHYLKAGSQFVQCGDLYHGGRCFQNAKAYHLAALAFEKNGNFEEAAYQYQRARKATEASRCFEVIGMFRRAIKVLADEEFYKLAIDCSRRYNLKLKTCEQYGLPVPDVLVVNKPRDDLSEANLSHKSAEFFYNKGNMQQMIAALERVKDTQVSVDFLKKKGKWAEAAEFLRKDGDMEKASKLLLEHGEVDKALEYAGEGDHKELEANIHLVLARKYEHEENFNLDLIKHHATKAMHMNIELGNKAGQALASLTLGQHTLDFKLIKQAKDNFSKAKPANLPGKIECYKIYMKMIKEEHHQRDVDFALSYTDDTFSVIKCLQHDTASTDVGKTWSFLNFYGLEQGENNSELTVHQHLYPMFPRIAENNSKLAEISQKLKKKDQGFSINVDRKLATDGICEYLSSLLVSWVPFLKSALDSQKVKKLQCERYLEGRRCEETCTALHTPYSKEQEKEALRTLLKKLDLDYKLQNGFNSLVADKKAKVLMKDTWASVKELFHFLVPAVPPEKHLDRNFLHSIITEVKGHPAMEQVKLYLEYLWNNQGRVGLNMSKDILKERAKSTDWIVRACFLSALLDLDLDVEKHVSMLESQLSKKNPPWLDKRRKYALFFERDNSGPYIEAMGMRFVQSFKYLTDPKQPNPYEAVFAFTKLISAFCNRAEVNQMPEMNHLLLWLECYFLLTYFLIAKANNMIPKGKSTSFYLVHSHLTSLFLVNECKPGNESVEKDVAQFNFPAQLKQAANSVQRRQEFMCNFLVGFVRYSRFSLINYIVTLCKADSPNYLLVERILILTIVTLLNIAKEMVFKDFETLIRRELYKLDPTPGMPPRLASLITSVQAVCDYRSLAAVLRQFLSARDGDMFVLCEWTGRITMPFQWREAGPKDIPDLRFYEVDLASLAEATMPGMVSQQQLEKDLMEDLDMEDKEKIRERNEKAKEEQKKQDAAKVIEKSVHVYLRWKKVLHILKTKAYKNFEIEELFKPYSLTATDCGVCGNALAPSTEANVDVDVGAIDEVEDSASVLPHGQTVGHKQAQKQLDVFRIFYEKQFHPVWDKVDRFIAKYAVQRENEIYKDITVNVSKLLNAVDETRKCLDEFFSRKAWRNYGIVESALTHLKKIFAENSNTVQGQFEASKKLQEENKQAAEQEKRLEEDMVEAVDVFAPTDKPVSQGPDQGRARGRGQGRGRGRGQRGREDFGGRMRGRGKKVEIPPRFRKQMQS